MKISIVTPSYNQAAFIERTINSIHDQTLSVPLEHIVVDGGSSDGTLDILKKYQSKIKWVSEKDKGQSDALNKGIAMASGEIIGWLNSDDVYLPGSLQKVVDVFIENPEIQWVYGMCRMIDGNDAELRSWITYYKKVRSLNFRYKRLLTENFISQPAVFFRKEAFVRAGGLDLQQHYAMDFDLWLRLGKESAPFVIREDIAAFRLHGTSKSMTNFKKLFSEQYEIHQKYDQGRFLLFAHRFKISLILLAYKALAVIGSATTSKG